MGGGGQIGQNWAQEQLTGVGAPIYVGPAGVRKVQEELSKRGYNVGQVDGDWNQQTVQAVQNFQRANGLVANGKLDVNLIAALGGTQEIFSAPILTSGGGTMQWTQETASGPGVPLWVSPVTVRQIEQRLNNAGYNVGQVDGQWDQQNVEAVMAYQRANGIEPTGTLTTHLLAVAGQGNWTQGQTIGNQQTSGQSSGGQQQGSGQGGQQQNRQGTLQQQTQQDSQQGGQRHGGFGQSSGGQRGQPQQQSFGQSGGMQSGQGSPQQQGGFGQSRGGQQQQSSGQSNQQSSGMQSAQSGQQQSGFGQQDPLQQVGFGQQGGFGQGSGGQQSGSTQAWTQEQTTGQGTQVFLGTAAVRQIQQQLNQTGFDVGNVDGTLNNQTASALADYQRSKGLEPTGTLTLSLLNSLGQQNLLSNPQQSTGGGGQGGQTWTQEQAVAAGAPLYIGPAGVRQIQQELNNRGYSVGQVDGQWNQATSQAVQNFQRTNGLEPNGKPDVNLIAALGGTQEIFSGQGQTSGGGMQWSQETASGSGVPLWVSPATVRQVQQTLNNAGYSMGQVDGQWGQQTVEAVMDYQRANGLEPTGTLTTGVLASIGQNNWTQGQSTSGQQSMGQSGFGGQGGQQQSSGQSAGQQNGFGQSGGSQQQSGFSQQGRQQEGFGSSFGGQESQQQASAGQQNGSGQQSGFGQSSGSQGGQQQGGFGQSSGFSQSGQSQSGFGQSSGAQGGQQQGGFGQSGDQQQQGFGPNGFGQSGFGQGQGMQGSQQRYNEYSNGQGGQQQQGWSQSSGGQQSGFGQGSGMQTGQGNQLQGFGPSGFSQEGGQQGGFGRTSGSQGGGKYGC
jgi:peptidoglycan hydrolase-like protein with peptidoglycan-binding domain